MQQAITDAFVSIGTKQPDVRLGRKIARTFGDKLKGVFVHDAPQERIDVINKFNETIVDCERKMLNIASKWKEGLVNVLGDQVRSILAETSYADLHAEFSQGHPDGIESNSQGHIAVEVRHGLRLGGSKADKTVDPP